MQIYSFRRGVCHSLLPLPLKLQTLIYKLLIRDFSLKIDPWSSSVHFAFYKINTGKKRYYSSSFCARQKGIHTPRSEQLPARLHSPGEMLTKKQNSRALHLQSDSFLTIGKREGAEHPPGGEVEERSRSYPHVVGFHPRGTTDWMEDSISKFVYLFLQGSNSEHLLSSTSLQPWCTNVFI